MATARNAHNRLLNRSLTYFVSFFPHKPRQPAKEEKVEESAEKSPEEAKVTEEEGEGTEEQKEQKEQEGGEVEGEKEAEGEGQTSIFQSPLRLVRKTKMKLVVCHVSLLDGTDFTCEVEVRLRQQNVKNKESWMWFHY